MRKITAVKTIALTAVAAAIAISSQGAFAHTGIKDKLFVEGIGNTGSGATAYNAFTVTHGCASNSVPEGTSATRSDVIGMAALFPNSIDSNNTIIYRYKTGSIAANVKGVDGTVLTGVATTLPVTTPTDLTDDIQGSVSGAGFSNMGLGIVSPNLFGNIILSNLDALSNLRGYAVANGPVQYRQAAMSSMPLQESVISTTGLSAFKFNVPKFKSTSCAKNLIVRVAVANWCKKEGGAAFEADRKDVWIGTDTGSVKYSMAGPDHAIMPNSRVTLGNAASPNEQGNGKSFWPAFTVTRDLVNNPLPAACNGESYDVVVSPSGADIDARLVIKSDRYPIGIPGAKFE
jgi:hypothetical protein